MPTMICHGKTPEPRRRYVRDMFNPGGRPSIEHISQYSSVEGLLAPETLYLYVQFSGQGKRINTQPDTAPGFGQNSSGSYLLLRWILIAMIAATGRRK